MTSSPRVYLCVIVPAGDDGIESPCFADVPWSWHVAAAGSPHPPYQHFTSGCRCCSMDSRSGLCAIVRIPAAENVEVGFSYGILCLCVTHYIER